MEYSQFEQHTQDILEGTEYASNLNKNYYCSTLSDDEEETSPTPAVPLSLINNGNRKRGNKCIDGFFENVNNKKKKATIQSSTVGRAVSGGTSYISTSKNDGAKSSHLIKIEVYDLKRLEKISPLEYWKHASVRIKYYAERDSKHFDSASTLIYDITKEIASSKDCKKYFFASENK